MSDSDANSAGESPPAEADFTERYQRLASALHAWASLRIRPSLRAYCDVDDLLQEAWCRAYAIRDRFDPAQVEFRPWLFRVAKNVLLETMRKATYADRAGRAQGGTARLFVLDAVPDHVTSITRRLARDENLLRFHARLRELPEDDRELVVLVGLEGMSQAEAATRLGTTYDAVRKRWQRLRARLEGDGVSEMLVE